MNQATLITGEVRDPQGRPAAQARVFFVSSPVPVPDIAMLTGADGKFTLSVPAGGVYQIGINADNCAPLTTTVTVTEGQDVALQLALTPD